MLARAAASNGASASRHARAQEMFYWHLVSISELVLRIKQMIHCRPARYRTYRPGPRSDRLYHLIASEH